MWNNNFQKTCGCRSCYNCQKNGGNKWSYKKELLKDHQHINSLMCQVMQYIRFFVVKNLFKKDDEQQKYLLQDFGLLVMKNQLPLQFVKCV